MAQSTTHPAMSWWYTLAHEETSPARLGVSAAALDEFSETLAARGQEAAARLVAQIAREVARTEAMRRALAPHRTFGEVSDQVDGERYVWAFRRLGDALTVLRANHRSDYHAYSRPQTLHEASLDRLYRRFPLDDYPRTTALLFTGMRICDDPRLWADPRANTQASALPALVAPEDWERYTVCGFRQGVALVRVTASARWLRVGARPLEDAWAEARHALDLSTLRVADEERLRLAETRARDTLLRAAPAEAFMRLDDEASMSPGRARGLSSAVAQRTREGDAVNMASRATQSSGKRLPYNARRPAV